MDAINWSGIVRLIRIHMNCILIINKYLKGGANMGSNEKDEVLALQEVEESSSIEPRLPITVTTVTVTVFWSTASSSC